MSHTPTLPHVLARAAYDADPAADTFRAAALAFGAYADSMRNRWVGFVARCEADKFHDAQQIFERPPAFEEWRATGALNDLADRLVKAVCLAIPAQIASPADCFGHVDVMRDSTDYKERRHSAERLMARATDQGAVAAWFEALEYGTELRRFYDAEFVRAEAAALEESESPFA